MEWVDGFGMWGMLEMHLLEEKQVEDISNSDGGMDVTSDV